MVMGGDTPSEYLAPVHLWAWMRVILLIKLDHCGYFDFVLSAGSNKWIPFHSLMILKRIFWISSNLFW